MKDLLNPFNSVRHCWTFSSWNCLLPSITRSCHRSCMETKLPPRMNRGVSFYHRSRNEPFYMAYTVNYEGLQY